jgi:hypothetical protein
MKNVSLGTVFLLKNSTSFDDKPRTGRPKKYSDKDFIYYIEKYPYFFFINVVISERKIETVKHLQSAPLKNGIMNTE